MAAVALAAACLFIEGLKLTRMLETQAALVFEDAAAREARARVPALEAAVHAAEAAALEALLDLPADPPASSIGRIIDLHPIIDAPFLLAADRSLLYPPSPAPPLAAMAGEDPAPDEYLRVRRMALEPSTVGQAIPAFAALSSAPEVAGPWRLRSRAAMAALQLRSGKASEAVAAYESIGSDFPEELREIQRPSQVELAAARAEAFEESGDREKARAAIIEEFRRLEKAGTAALGGQDAEILIDRAWRLKDDRYGETILATQNPEFSGEVWDFSGKHAAAARGLEFSRKVKEWIESRLRRGEGGGRFAEELGRTSRRGIVAWTRGRPGNGPAAAGFLLKDHGVLAALEPASGDGLPLSVVQAPTPTGFKELASLPGPLDGFRVGLDRVSWEKLLGAARRPFRLAILLEVALGLLLVGGSFLGWRAFRQEMFLARMKTEFVANVSHELKTPLALIRLFGETLLFDRVKDPSKAKEYFGIITRESERLTHLVNNILDFSSLSAGRKTFDLKPCSLGQVVEETFAAYRFQLEERGFRSSLQVIGDIPAAMADPDAVAQALINLLQNSVRYSPREKEVAVKVERSGGAVRISVADRGMGIAPAERRRVFEEFYRSPAARSLGTRGSGLGLTLVQRILEAHGGSVEVASVLGEGSTFTLVFPVATETRAAPGPGPAEGGLR
jgi:signal transduction histidine kinase